MAGVYVQLLFSSAFWNCLKRYYIVECNGQLKHDFLLPDFQSGFRNFRFCTDNLVTFTNRIHSAFLNNSFTIAVFLDIAGAFDNVIPQILIQELRNAGFPTCFCKLIENLLVEDVWKRLIHAGTFQALWSSMRAPLQGSILSPLLFNFYLRNIDRCLHKDIQILQYVEGIVLFSSNRSLLLAWDSLTLSLNAVHEFLLFSLGLDLAPHKSQSILFLRRANLPGNFEPFVINGIWIPMMDCVRFLGVTFDRKLNGAFHLKFLLVRGYRVSNIVTSLLGVWWKAHSLLLLSVYRSIYQSSIEYRAQILKLHRNCSLFLKIQHQHH